MRSATLAITAITLMLVAMRQSGAIARAATQESTATTAPAAVLLPSDYVIGPEDVLSVVFWREPDMSGEVTVRPDGRISLPLLGDVIAVGLKPDALRDQVQTAAGRFLADANVNIAVKQINSRKVFITGQVAQPGAFPLTAPRTVLQLIALAGGLNEYAEGNRITIMRTEQGRTSVLKFDYKKVSKGSALEQNVALIPGDTVVVP